MVNVSFVNQKMADMLGFSREEMIGKTVMDFVYMGSTRSLKVQELHSEGTSIWREYRLHCKEGERSGRMSMLLLYLMRKGIILATC